jgi:hypothetical protein
VYGTHYQGSAGFSLNPGSELIIQHMYLTFPSQGGATADAKYLQDSLKLYVQFRNVYHKVVQLPMRSTFRIR